MPIETIVTTIHGDIIIVIQSSELPSQLSNNYDNKHLHILWYVASYMTSYRYFMSQYKVTGYVNAPA